MVGYDSGGPGLMAEQRQEAGRATPGAQRPLRRLEVGGRPGQQRHRLIGSVVPQGIQTVTDLVGGLPQLALGLQAGIGQAGGGHHRQAGDDEADDRDPAPDSPPRAEVGRHEHGRDRGGSDQGRQAGVVQVDPQEDLHRDRPHQARRAAGTGDAVRQATTANPRATSPAATRVPPEAVTAAAAARTIQVQRRALAVAPATRAAKPARQRMSAGSHPAGSAPLRAPPTAERATNAHMRSNSSRLGARLRPVGRRAAAKGVRRPRDESSSRRYLCHVTRGADR